MSVLSSLSEKFSKDKRTGVEIFQADMDKNPFYPFQLGLTYEDRSRVFSLRVPYKEKHWGSLVALGTGILIFLLLVTGTQRDSAVFVYLVFILIQSCAVVIHFRSERIYILDEGTKTYSFVVGGRSTTGAYHNVYIRLSKEKVFGKPEKTHALPKYHLVLDGVKIDRQTLTRKSTSDIKMLRKYVCLVFKVWELRANNLNQRLGQRLAKNININYFDEANGTFVW